MTIRKDHLYHGAALTQIAEHKNFTSINVVRTHGEVSRAAFRVNETIGVYLKYCADKPRFGGDYIFTFSEANKEELESLQKLCEDVYLVLIVVKKSEICCVSYKEFKDWLERRNDALGYEENASTILVNVPTGKSFRVNMNRPGRRKVYLSPKPQIVARNRFPDGLFE